LQVSQGWLQTSGDSLWQPETCEESPHLGGRARMRGSLRIAVKHRAVRRHDDVMAVTHF
jgi:hypothetical protein